MKKRAKKMSRKQITRKIKLVILSCLIILSFVTEKVNLVYADVVTSIDILFNQEFIDADRNTITTANQELIYELVATTDGNPMPVGSVDGVYETTLKGNAVDNVEIIFDKAGKFEYTLKSSSKNDLQGLIPASEMSYRIEVTVLKEMGGDLESFAFAFNADGEKVADPPFIYTVKEAEATITPALTITPAASITKRPVPSITKRPAPSITKQPAGQGGIVKTGDTTKIYTLISLALASTGVIILAIAKRRKKDEI